MLKLKNEDITIGKLGEERTFISGTKNWRIEWAELDGERYEVGTNVSFIDEDDNKEFIGHIEWMIVTADGEVQVSIADTTLGRVNLEDLQILG